VVLGGGYRGHKCKDASRLIFLWIQDILRKDIGEWQGKKLKAVVCKLAWSSAVYNIWKHQNDVNLEVI
jgi:hypothetical protein